MFNFLGCLSMKYCRGQLPILYPRQGPNLLGAGGEKPTALPLPIIMPTHFIEQYQFEGEGKVPPPPSRIKAEYNPGSQALNTQKRGDMYHKRQICVLNY